ncbi:NNT, partial [Symbiodinium sp. CCMP2456]
VDDEGHSPTEIADEEDMEEVQPPGGVLVTKEEIAKDALRGTRKKKRERSGPEIKQEEEEESPNKRALASGDAPLSGRELRELLQMHMFEMRAAWGEERARVDRLEHKQGTMENEVSEMKGRTAAMEIKVQEHSTTQGRHERKLDEIAEVYADAVQQFFKGIKKKWKQYPIVVGADVNEQPGWHEVEDGRFEVINANVNLSSFLEEAMRAGIWPNSPSSHLLRCPTHYPRDTTREGRQIDMILGKSVSIGNTHIRPELRHCIGTDHAELNADIFSSISRRQAWGQDTRPRRLTAILPDTDTIVDSTDLKALAKECTAPRASPCYVDSLELKELINRAREFNDKEDWKRIHKLRKKAIRQWQKDRAEKVVQGDWSAFRSYKRDRVRRKGWWGRMLQDKSAAELTKVRRPERWHPYTKEEIFETPSHMKTYTAVGLDLVCVDLIKAIILHDVLGSQLVDLINHIIYHNEQPEEWSVRRQVADLIGAMTRMRDIAHEWREPLLFAKLDVAGAFDRLSRDEVAEMIVSRTKNTALGVEAQFLLRQLDINVLRGMVPGGHEITVEANVGIRQGSPDSAELFGLVMGMLLDDMLERDPWKNVGLAFKDLPVDLFFFQDDVFVFDTTAARLARKIEIIGGALGKGGLKLAMNKTKVIASPDYKGKMTLRVEKQDVTIHKDSAIRVLGVSFDLGETPAQQAEELLGSWSQKAFIISMLITATWRWSAGCVHWSKESLAKANSLQAQIFRSLQWPAMTGPVWLRMFVVPLVRVMPDKRIALAETSSSSSSFSVSATVTRTQYAKAPMDEPRLRDGTLQILTSGDVEFNCGIKTDIDVPWTTSTSSTSSTTSTPGEIFLHHDESTQTFANYTTTSSTSPTAASYYAPAHEAHLWETNWNGESEPWPTWDESEDGNGDTLLQPVTENPEQSAGNSTLEGACTPQDPGEGDNDNLEQLPAFMYDDDYVMNYVRAIEEKHARLLQAKVHSGGEFIFVILVYVPYFVYFALAFARFPAYFVIQLYSDYSGGGDAIRTMVDAQGYHPENTWPTTWQDTQGPPVLVYPPAHDEAPGEDDLGEHPSSTSSPAQAEEVTTEHGEAVSEAELVDDEPIADKEDEETPDKLQLAEESTRASATLGRPRCPTNGKEEKKLRDCLRETGPIPEEEEIHSEELIEENSVNLATSYEAQVEGDTQEEVITPGTDSTTVDEGQTWPDDAWAEGWTTWNGWNGWTWSTTAWRWEDSGWTRGTHWETTSTSSTSTTTTMMDASSMQLTDNERSNLEQLRVPTVQVDRFAQLLDVLQDHQVQERGPESRWALQCVLRRAEHAEEALELMLNVISRRLQPRGVYPITRTPGTDNQMRNLYSWAQNFASVILHSMEEILRRPLFEHDFEPEFVGQNASSSSSVRAARTEGRSPSSSPPPGSTTSVRVRSRSWSRATDDASHEATGSERIHPFEGVNSPTMPTDSGSSTALPSASSGPLLGIWREPDTEEGDDADEILSSQMTSLTTTSQPSTAPSSSSTPSSIWMGEFGAMESNMRHVRWTTTSTTPVQYAANSTSWSGWADGLTCCSTTTTTTEERSIEEAIRDAVNLQVFMGGRSDVRDLMRRLLDRLRALHRLQRLTQVAIEELQLWMVQEDMERPWNAATQEHLLWHVISNGANGASGSDPALVLPEVAHVILQPNLPDRENLRRQLPGQSVRHVVGYRRRAWRQHANQVMRGRQGEPEDVPVNDQHLFLVQTNSTSATSNIPLNAPVPPDPHRDQVQLGMMVRLHFMGVDRWCDNGNLDLEPTQLLLRRHYVLFVVPHRKGELMVMVMTGELKDALCDDEADDVFEAWARCRTEGDSPNDTIMHKGVHYEMTIRNTFISFGVSDTAKRMLIRSHSEPSLDRDD